MKRFEYQFSPNQLMKWVCYSILVISLWMFMLGSAHGMSEKYLLIHLDAISSADFYRHWEVGDLPNLQKIFSDGVATQGITLYPPGTEIILERMRVGEGNSQGLPVAWEHYDRNNDSIVRSYGFILDIYWTIPRISRSQYIMSVPGLNHLTGLKLLNIPSLLKQYDVLEYYWFHSDLVGHYLGEKALERSIRDFDRYMGLLYQKGIPDELNIILYADHGMTTGELKPVPLNQILREVAGEDMIFSITQIFI